MEPRLNEKNNRLPTLGPL